MALLLRRVRAAVRRTCPAYLASQAEDIAQEVLLRLLRKLHRSEGEATFSSMYLLKVAHGVTVDEIRRRSRRPENTGPEEALLTHEDPGPGPEDLARGRSMGREIRDCLLRIVPSRRLAVTLHLLGCPVSEIAERLSCTYKSAENRVYRGLKNLRSCLEARGWNP